MRAQNPYAKTLPRSSPHNTTSRPQPPHTSPQAPRRLDTGWPRTDIAKCPLVEGFPYINASPRTAGTTATARATNPAGPPGDTPRVRESATGGQDRQHHQDRQGFRRHRTGGLFVEASDPSPSPSPPPRQQPQPPPPPDFSPRSLAGLYTRALFGSNSQENCPYSEEEYSREGSKTKSRRCRLFPAARMSEKVQEVGVEQRTGPTMRQKAKRHCLRWWWVYLLVFVCIVVLVVCLV